MLKKSDWQTISELPSEFKRLRSLIEALRNDDNGRSLDRELKWLGDPDAEEEDPASLWGRRTQVFARFTHERFTFGQNSTTRSESINSGELRPSPPPCSARAHSVRPRRASPHPTVAKNPFNALVHGKMSLCVLATTIKKMEDEANTKAEIQNVIDMRRWANKVHKSHILIDLEKRLKVSAHGLAIAAGVSARVQSYSCEPAPGPPLRPPDVDPSSICLRGCAPGCARSATGAAAAAPTAPAQDGDYCFSCQPPPSEFFYVKHIASAGSSSSPIGAIQPSELASLDFGFECELEDKFTCHITSASTCTCQMNDHLGLPCAHMFRVWMQLNLTRVPDGVVALRWSQRRDVEEELSAHTAQMQAAARRHLREEELRRQRPAGEATRVLSEGEKYLALTSKAKVLIAGAISSSARYAAVDKMLSSALRDAADGVLGMTGAQSKRMREALHAQARVDESAQLSRAAEEEGEEEGVEGGEVGGEEEEEEELVVDAELVFPPAPKHIIAHKRRLGPGMRPSKRRGGVSRAGVGAAGSGGARMGKAASAPSARAAAQQV